MTFLIIFIHVFLNFHLVSKQFNIYCVVIFFATFSDSWCAYGPMMKRKGQFLHSESYFLKEVRELDKEMWYNVIRVMTDEFECDIGMHRASRWRKYPEEWRGNLLIKWRVDEKSLLRNSNPIPSCPNCMQMSADLEISRDLLYFVLLTVSVSLSCQLPHVLPW